MTKIIVSALIGAVILMAWNFSSWMVLGFHDKSMHDIGAQEAELTELFRDAEKPSGVYVFPYTSMEKTGDPQVDDAAWNAFAERHRQGPTGMLIYKAEGSEPMAPMMFVKGFGLYFAGAFLAACLLSAAAVGIRRYAGRVIFVLTIGLMVGILSDLSYWNWAGFPMEYIAPMVLDHAAGWLIVGIFMAAIIRKKTVELTAVEN